MQEWWFWVFWLQLTASHNSLPGFTKPPKHFVIQPWCEDELIFFFYQPVNGHSACWGKCHLSLPGSNIHPRISSSDSKQLLFQAALQRFSFSFHARSVFLIAACWHLQHTAGIVLHEAITFQLMMLRRAARLLCMYEMNQTNQLTHLPTHIYSICTFPLYWFTVIFFVHLWQWWTSEEDELKCRNF